jgi:hypothetical protein
MQAKISGVAVRQVKNLTSHKIGNDRFDTGVDAARKAACLG